MAVLSLDVGMSSSENDQTNDSNHENNLYADRQLQNRLLQVEEDSDMAEYDQKLSKSWSNLKPKSSRPDTRIDSINGWFPNVKFVARKTEGLQRPETKPTFIHPWKDYRSKKEDSFVFKHYTDCRNYIEQYRNEHGCHGTRYPSGNQIGDMRRVAFQGTAPPQHSPITVQQMQQSGYSTVSPQSANNQSSLHYASRKEQLGTLITGSTTANNSAGKRTNYIDSSSHAQKYRVNNTNGKLPRNNTVFDLRNADSDNSSEGGVDVRLRSPSRRSNSASSTRTKSRNTTKSPTKITVPASSNPRSYPLQALTIAWRLQRQQNGKPPDICPSPKPLDNLNCVAPEKQSNSNERKPLEQPSLELALRVHSLNDLLVANEAPLRGYALPKSLPPNPNNTSNSKCFKRDQEFEGMTWSEKLEALRSVNKPPEKVKSKQPKLKFVKAEPTDAMFVLSVEHNRLNEQRRIRHLVEQARLKGGKQFDWVYEAQVKSRDIDWEGVMESETDVNVTDSVMIDRSTGELTEHSAGAGDNLGRIYSPSVKQIKQTLINSRNLDKSNTSVTQ